jgi:6-pyruvoyltetrahydropterin/6-carboxytetrahydropterin synthase
MTGPVSDNAIFEVSKSCGFDAAHNLADGLHDEGYGRLHGHSFRVEISVRGPARPPVGWVEDLGELEAALKTICQELDHSLLNTHPGLERPTLEALCAYFAERLDGVFTGLARIVVSRPTLGERCSYDL